MTLFGRGIFVEYIHDILEVITIPSASDVLATIIHVEGSAYQKEGTSMLIREDGRQIGVLSGGCLENDLVERAKLLREGQSQCIKYDMKSEDDLSWGQGAGCNGVVHVLLECIDDRFRKHLRTLKDFLDRGISVVIIKKFTAKFSVSDYLFYVDDTNMFGEWNVSIPKNIPDLKNHKSGLVYVEELSSFCYFHCFQPKPRLIIFGAGRDAACLASFAAKTGFSVTVCDWRAALCNKENFPDADQLIVGSLRETVMKLQFTSRDFVVILTHQFQRDQELLQLLIEKDLRYIGVMGSKQRTSRLLNFTELPPQISTPVGLSIGAEGPEEIAISILAELIHLKKKPLKGRVPLL